MWKNESYWNKKILVTRAAEFIGAYLVLELLKTKSPVNIIGIDSLNDYYDVNIKHYRLHLIEKTVDEHSESIWNFILGNIADKSLIDKVLKIIGPKLLWI